MWGIYTALFRNLQVESNREFPFQKDKLKIQKITDDPQKAPGIDKISIGVLKFSEKSSPG